MIKKKYRLSLELWRWSRFKRKLKYSRANMYFRFLRGTFKVYANRWWYRAQRYFEFARDSFRLKLGWLLSVYEFSRKFKKLFKRKELFSYVRWSFNVVKNLKFKGFLGLRELDLGFLFNGVLNKNLVFIVFERIVRSLKISFRLNWLKVKLLNEVSFRFIFKIRSNIRFAGVGFFEKWFRSCDFISAEFDLIMKRRFSQRYRQLRKEFYCWVEDSINLRALKVSDVREVQRMMDYDGSMVNNVAAVLNNSWDFKSRYLGTRMFAYNWWLTFDFFSKKKFRNVKRCYFVFTRSPTNYFLSVMDPSGKLLGKMSGGTAIRLKKRRDKLTGWRNTRSMYKFMEVYVLDPLQYKLIYIIIKFREQRLVWRLQNFIRFNGKSVFGLSIIRPLPHGFGLRRPKVKRR